MMPQVDVASILNNTSLHPVLGQNNTPIKISLLLYNILVIVMGVGGNTLVLIGSRSYRAIQMDRRSVLLLEHIAVADLIATILQYIPMLVTLVTERWVFGEMMCFLAVFRYVPFVSECAFIAIMSCYRVNILRSPFIGISGSGTLKKVLASVWMFYLILIPCLSRIKPIIKYTPSALHCSSFDWENVTDVTFYLRIIRLISGLCLSVPILITMIANISILHFVITHPSLNNSGYTTVKTISTVCWIFVASYLPTIFIFFLPVAGVTDIPQWVNCMSMYAVSFNLILNPVIYSLSNNKFAVFVKLFFTGRLKEFSRGSNL